MGWEFSRTTIQTAQKEYRCQASDWVCNADLAEDEYAPEDWQAVEKAKAERWRILPGTQYVKTVGKWDGEFQTFRARLDMDDICRKYDFYYD